MSLDGYSVKKKKKQLREAVEADVILATYDAARLYGVPTLYASTAKLFKQANLIPNPTLRAALMGLNDEVLQLRFATNIADGRPNKDIIAEIEKITQALPTCLEHLPYKIIVSDESHRIKHIQSHRTRYCLQLSAKAQRRYLLTGTMSDGDPRGLYPQLSFLAPYLVPEDWDTFCKNHLVMARGCKHIVVQYKNIDVLNKRVDLVSSTKMLDDCVDLPKQLPPVTVYYDLSAEQRKEYNRAAKDYKLWRTEDAEELDLAHSAVVISKLLQICSGFVYVPEKPDPSLLMSSLDLHSKLPVPGHDTQRYSTNPKLASLMELLEDMLNGQKSKVIVWANYTAELDDIEGALKNAGVGYVRVDGSNSIRVLKYVEMFQNDPKIQVYLAQETTGESITLTAAKYMVYYSRSWYLDAHRQSKMRNYRIGQTQHTGIYFLVAAGTTEEQQLTALEHNVNLATMLTHHHNCAVCMFYSKCLDRGVKPWDNECVLDKDPHRVVTKPTPLKEEDA
jgi:SNF2 family DNA or RNA helicase